jgi:hypothetical protein
MVSKLALWGILLVVSLFALLSSPGSLRAQQNASAPLREQAAKLQQDIEALKKSKADLSGRISESLLSSLESEIQAKETALESARQEIKQAEALERDIADLTSMRDKMQGHVSNDLLGKMNEEVAAKRQALARLSDPVAPGVSAATQVDDPPTDLPPATAATPGAAPAENGQEESTTRTNKASSQTRKSTKSTATRSTRTSSATAAEKRTQPTTPASPPAEAGAPAKTGGAATQPAGAGKGKPSPKPERAQQGAKQPTTPKAATPAPSSPTPAGQEQAQAANPSPQAAAATGEECANQPCADQPYDGQTWVTGKVATGSKITVTVTVNGREKQIEGAVDANGLFRASPIDPPLKAFQVVGFKVDKGGPPAPMAVKPASTCEEASAPLPCLNQPYQGDNSVSGKARVSSNKVDNRVDTIKINGAAGLRDPSITQDVGDKKGTFEKMLQFSLSAFDTVEADQTDAQGNILSGTVVKVADGPVPQAPAVSTATNQENQSAATGQAPLVTFSPTSLIFESREIKDKSNSGKQSKPSSEKQDRSNFLKTVTVTNDGTDSLKIDPRISGENPGDFGVDNTTPAPPGSCEGSLAKGASCAITVEFTPKYVGIRRAILTINSTDNVHRLWLQGGAETSKLNPARFVRVFEDTEGGDHPISKLSDCNHCIQIYNPDHVKSPPRKTVQLTADEKSGIIVLPDINLMTQDLPLNKLYITAQLISGGNKSDVTVVSYSEMGKDQATSAVQNGMAFESAKDIELKIVNMNNVAEDVLKYAYCTDALAPKPPGCAPRQDLKFTDDKGNPDKNAAKQESSLRRDVEMKAKIENTSGLAQRLKDRLRLHQEEIKSFVTFFQENTELALVQLIGTDALHIDRDSLSSIVSQFKDDVNIVFNDKSTGDAINESLLDILERTKIVYNRFAPDRAAIRALAVQYKATPAAMPLPACKAESDALAQASAAETMLGTGDSAELQAKRTAWEDAVFSQAGACATYEYILTIGGAALLKLKSQIVPGYISLQNAGAKDGDRLIVTVLVPGEGNTQGISVPFDIAIKRYGWKPQVADSFMFVHRQGLTLKDLSGNTNPGNPGLNRVNFAPSPGVTFSVIYLRRGDDRWDKFVRALGPGIGMNVSFMNFNDPSFDQSTGQFTNTTGLNIQEGAGIVGSFFDNKIQFSRGWNLNAARKRQYWSVGFGFIEITKEVAKYVKQK